MAATKQVAIVTVQGLPPAPALRRPVEPDDYVELPRCWLPVGYAITISTQYEDTPRWMEQNGAR